MLVSMPFLHWKNDFAERFKILLDTDLKIILLHHTQRKKSYQQLEIWGQIAPQLCIIKL